MEEPSLEEGSSLCSNCEPSPGPKHGEASITLFYFISVRSTWSSGSACRQLPSHQYRRPYALKVPRMFPECSLNVHWMFTETFLIQLQCGPPRRQLPSHRCRRPCSLSVPRTLTEWSLNVHWTFTECSLNEHWMFTECSLNVHWMFPECSLNVHWTFTDCSLIVQRMFTEYSLNVGAHGLEWESRHLLDIPDTAAVWAPPAPTSFTSMPSKAATFRG
jgi:hypothetical protein